jgi:hypothetical protein
MHMPTSKCICQILKNYSPAHRYDNQTQTAWTQTCAVQVKRPSHMWLLRSGTLYLHVKEAASISLFKTHLKTYLFKLAFNLWLLNLFTVYFLLAGNGLLYWNDPTFWCFVVEFGLVRFLPDTHCEWDMRFTNEILLCHGDSVTNWTQTDPHRENGTTHHIHPHPGEREKRGRAGLNTHSLVICCIHSWMQATLALHDQD